MTVAAHSETRDAAAAWHLKMADGSLSAAEENELERWLDASPENRATFDRMALIWARAPETADAPEMVAARADALEAMRRANARRWSSRRLVRRFWPAIAVAATLFITILAGGLFPTKSTALIQTGIGERRIVRLEDGSRVSLDAATRVSVEYTRSARRLHLLSGRAKFDVAKNADRPFSVTAGDRTVVATGTAFSVELLAHEVRVILYEGHVRVLAGTTNSGSAPPVGLASASPARRAITADQALKPGTVLIAPLDEPLATVRPTHSQPSLSWQAGQLIFTDDPLAVAVERIDRYADTPIIVDGPASHLPISGAFDAGDSAGFIDGVSALYPLKTTRRGDAVVLSLAHPIS